MTDVKQILSVDMCLHFLSNSHISDGLELLQNGIRARHRTLAPKEWIVSSYIGETWTVTKWHQSPTSDAGPQGSGL